jgi:coronin-1B/1C/6
LLFSFLKNKIAGHAGPVLDFDFHPFDDSLIATASEDSTIKLWQIPEGGLKENVTTPLIDLTNHTRKVTLLRFHPTANNVILSSSADQTVKLWDIEKGIEVNSNNDVNEHLIQDIAWDYHGNNYAISSKDKAIRIVDGRTAKTSTVIENAHDGTKSFKLCYLGQSNKLVSVGFTKTSLRQFKIWDPRNTAEEILKVEIDQAAGVIMPFYDADTGLLYLAGKGDGNVRAYEISNEGDQAYLCTDFRSNVSAKGMAWVPKRALNIMQNETARLLKLTTNSVEPLSFFVPRKSEGFQEDLFPDTASNEPSHTADEWLAGSDKPPKLVSLDPAKSGSAAGGSKTGSVVRSKSYKSMHDLTLELEAANARIKELEDKLRANNISTD